MKIFRQLHREPYHPQLYSQRFSAILLLVRVAISWTQYYPYSPYTAGPIKIFLLREGHTVDEVSFVRVPKAPRSIPSPPKPPTLEISGNTMVVGIALGIVGAIYLLNQTN